MRVSNRQKKACRGFRSIGVVDKFSNAIVLEHCIERFEGVSHKHEEVCKSLSIVL